MLNKREFYKILIVWIVWIVWIVLIIILLSIVPLLYFFHIVTNDKVLTVIGFVIWVILMGMGSPYDSSYKIYMEKQKKSNEQKNKSDQGDKDQ